MRIFLFLEFVLFICLSCSDKEKEEENPPFNTEVIMSINTCATLSKAQSSEDVARLDLIKSAYEICGTNIINQSKGNGRGIIDENRDTINLKFNFYGYDVIAPGWNAGEYKLEWLSSELVNVVFTRPKANNVALSDTIGYIPNSIIKNIHKRIKTAFITGDYDTCYEIFDHEYIAYPCTGEQYRKLVADGIEKPYILGTDIEEWYNEE